MQTFTNHLQEELTKSTFAQAYEEELYLLKLATKVIDERKEQGLTQKDLAQKAHVTQQQLSKIENGINCNILTFLKVCQALGIQLFMNKKNSAV